MKYRDILLDKISVFEESMADKILMNEAIKT